MARFDCATWRPISANTSGRISPNLGLILHHAVGNGSLFARFNNPASQVSATFWVSQSGAIEQYVDSDVMAWHARDLNGTYCGVETEGCASAANGYADPMSDAMTQALGRLYAEGMRRHGWPAVLCNAKGQAGFGYHRLPGSQNGPGGSFPTACPCDVRLDRRADILAIATGSATPSPEPKPKGTHVWTMRDKTSGGTWVADESGALFAYDGAPYLGGANVYNDGGWPCSGLAEYSDAKGEGYLITLDAGAGAKGDRYLRYRFPRDGSAAKK